MNVKKGGGQVCKRAFEENLSSTFITSRSGRSGDKNRNSISAKGSSIYSGHDDEKFKNKSQRVTPENRALHQRVCYVGSVEKDEGKECAAKKRR